MNSMFKHILFPVDFSDASAAALPAAVEMARHSGAKITLLHVFHIPAVYYSSIDPVGQLMDDLPLLLEQASDKLDTLAQTVTEPVSLEKVVVQGDPGPVIVSWAAENDVDLIMMGTHGHGLFRTLLLGSVTAKVLHDASCAVWTAPHTVDSAPRKNPAQLRMLCALNASGGEEKLISGAVALARDCSAQLWLVHAVPLPTEPIERSMDAEFCEYLVEASRKEIADLQEKAETNLPVCVHEGAVSDVVRSAAIEHKADLVVIGRGHIHDTLGRLRTHTYAIIRDAPCPVLSLPAA